MHRHTVFACLNHTHLMMCVKCSTGLLRLPVTVVLSIRCSLLAFKLDTNHIRFLQIPSGALRSFGKVYERPMRADLSL
jgi:hypothetical protein